MKRYFTYKDDKSDKFWSLEIQENKLYIVYGKTGTAGTLNTQTFEDQEDTAKAADKLIRAKINKGYLESLDADIIGFGETEFWSLLNRAKAKTSNCSEQAELLLEILSERSEQDILGFGEAFNKLHAKSYTAELWAAAYIINGGCSDDGFEYFRGWLIAQGEGTYYRALENPENLARVVQRENEGEFECEEMLSLAYSAYESQKGKESADFYDILPGVSLPELALDWEEEGDDLEKMFPILWKKFSQAERLEEVVKGSSNNKKGRQSPSTQNLSLIPHPDKLQNLTQSLASLEAILCPEWEDRYYSYNKAWTEEEACCQMRNGSGDEMLILFSPAGTVINGFAHESEMSGWRLVQIKQPRSFLEKMLGKGRDHITRPQQEIWPGVVDELPEVLHEFIFGEPVKSIGTTFCIWQTSSDAEWKIGDITFPESSYLDGSQDLMRLLDGKAETYRKWAIDYYELEELNLSAVQKIYDQVPISASMVYELNPELQDIEKLTSDLVEMGYPYQL